MSNRSSSPACYAAEADDAYMGYAGRDELLNALNELLEAERAGARVAYVTAKSAIDPAHVELMRSVRADEARWCAMLSRQIRRLDGEPSGKTGSFYGKAMAIDAAVERLALLNRGQAWVVRKLEAVMPRVRDEHLYLGLREMLESHRSNIARTDRFLSARTP